MGDIEVFINFSSIFILGFIIYNVINCFFFRDLIRRFGFTKLSRKDFYECGFRPQQQKPIRLSIQFLLITIFFLIYDIELIFIFPYVSGLLENGVYDLILFLLFILLFMVSIWVDFERHALYWQY